MKRILFALCLYFTLQSLGTDRITHSNVIRDSAGAIAERWQWTPRPDGSWLVTVRDAAGRLLRTFVVRHFDGMEKP